jgi:hypothetical protein
VTRALGEQVNSPWVQGYDTQAVRAVLVLLKALNVSS